MSLNAAVGPSDRWAIQVPDSSRVTGTISEVEKAGVE